MVVCERAEATGEDECVIYTVVVCIKSIEAVAISAIPRRSPEIVFGIKVTRAVQKVSSYFHHLFPFIPILTTVRFGGLGRGEVGVKYPE